MKRILIVRTDRIGDAVMITPMVRELRRAFPDAFIATLTQPNTRSIFLNNPHLNLALEDDLKKETFWKVVRELKSYKFTDGLLVYPTERAAFQMFFACIKNRIGVGHIFYEIITFMKGVSRNNYTPLRHEADYCIDLVRKIGVVTNNIQPEIFVTDQEKRETINFLKAKGISENDKKIIIHTGSAGSSPNWSEGKYARMVKMIINEYRSPNLKIILTARETGQAFITNISEYLGDKIVDVSQCFNDLRDIIKVISVADILISSSTGPLHLANALNVGCIGLYCHRPMNCSALWGVFNKRSINLEVSDEYCRTHCSTDKEKCDFEEGISIEQVLNNVHKLISK